MSNVTPRSIAIFGMVLDHMTYPEISAIEAGSYPNIIDECERVIDAMISLFNLKDYPTVQTIGLVGYRKNATYWKPWFNQFTVVFKRSYTAPDPHYKTKTAIAIGFRLMRGMSCYDAIKPYNICSATALRYLRDLCNEILDIDAIVKVNNPDRYRIRTVSDFRNYATKWSEWFPMYLRRRPELYTFLPGETNEEYVKRNLIKITVSAPKKKVRYDFPKTTHS